MYLPQFDTICNTAMRDITLPDILGAKRHCCTFHGHLRWLREQEQVSFFGE